MNMFKRLKDIVSSNVNSALDKMEDPEKMIKLMISDMEETLIDAKASAAATLASISAREKEVLTLKSSIQRWEERAKLAVTNAKDDLAREALAEKKKVASRVNAVEEELVNLKAISQSQQDQIVQLGEKLEEMKNKERILIARATHAKEKIEVAEQIQATDCSDIIRKFSELESKIERLEADADMAGFNGGASESQFTQMEHDQAVEDELAALKAATTKEKK